MKKKMAKVVVGLMAAATLGVLATSCGDLKSPHEHAYGEWQEVVAPTLYAEGQDARTCDGCGDTQTRPVEKVPAAFWITTVVDDVEDSVPVAADGAYDLAIPQVPIGTTFTGWVDEYGTPVPSSGTIGADMTVYATYDLAETTSFAQLKAYVEGGASEVYITQDITLTDTIYVSGEVTIYAETDCTLLRASDFLGDLFVLGRTASGENATLEGSRAKLILEGRAGGSLTIDGNKSAVTGSVAGTAFFIENSAILDMGNGVSIVNHKKTANGYLLEDDHFISDPELVGGAAVIVADGAFNMYGGSISGCEVDMDDSATTSSAEQVEGYNNSSRGGAIFNQGTFTMYGGVIEDCKAGRGGAVYNYRVAYFYAGTIRDNYTSSYGGVMYQPNSQYVYSVWGEEGTEIKMLVEGNRSGKSGGALYVAHQSSVYIQGATKFLDNAVESGNGGAMNVAGELVVDYAVFEGNTAKSKGGAIYAYYNEPANAVRVINLKGGVFQDNSADKGGAVAFGNGSDVSTGSIGNISNATFIGNAATTYGGALHIDNASTVTIGDGTIVEGNTAEKGGAIYATKESTVTVKAEETAIVFEGNEASDNGGAIYNSSSAITLWAAGANVLFDSNVSEANGGAIAAHSGGNVDVYGVAFQSNQAADKGGALYVYGATATIGDQAHQAATLFEGNSAKSGGGIYVSATSSNGASINAYEITLTNNTASGNGGGMYVYTSAVVNVEKLNATGNTADYGGGAYASGAATFTIGTIAASGNVAEKGGALYLTTTDTSLTIGAGSLTGNTATEASSGNAIWVNTKKAILTVKTGTVYAADDILGASGFVIKTE